MLPCDGRNCKVTWERTQIQEGCHLSGFALNKLIVFLSISIAIYPPISFCPHNHNTLSMYSLKWRQEVKSLSLMIINPFSSVLFKAPLFLSGAAREEQRQPFLSIRAPPLEPVDWRRRSPFHTHTHQRSSPCQELCTWVLSIPEVFFSSLQYS